VIRGARVLTPYGLLAASLGIAGGRIAALGGGKNPVADETLDANGLWVIAGAVDGHTHMEAPAFGIRSRDTFESGTKAAAAGGVTTIVDFTVAAGKTLGPEIESRIDAARGAVVDVALHAEIAGWRSDRAGEVADAVRLGVRSFKFYTVYAERSDPEQLSDAFRAIAAVDGVAMVHAEDEEIVRASSAALSREERRRATALPRSRPAIAESTAVSLVAALAERAGVRLHIAHVSSAGGCDAVRRAKARGVRITAETCPHYLVLDEGVYERADGRAWSVIPPLRTAADREALWSALRDGTVDAVATDHCPFLRADKEAGDDVLEIPCGLPGVETLLPILFSEGRARGVALERLAALSAEAPARIFGLSPRKGRIAVGADADLVFYDPHRAWTVRAAGLHGSGDVSPYEGLAVRGAVVRTLVRGRTVWADGAFVGAPGWGRFVPAV
jgi:dihydropyrimidinase